MERALEKVETFAREGKVHKRTATELELLQQFEAARDFMLTCMRNNSDRAALRDILGGDCNNIARVRAAVESAELSEMNKGDQRLPTCLHAVASVEQVLEDAGFAGTLH